MRVGPDSPHRFCDILNLLFSLTVLKKNEYIRPYRLREGSEGVALGGWTSPEEPLPLTDGRFLALSMRLYVASPEEKSYLKVSFSKIQYQLDKLGDKWVFRYEFIRKPPADNYPHPLAHLHVNAKPLHPESLPPSKKPLPKVHFPTFRVPVEAIIRLLIEHYDVPPNEPDLWRPVLAETEKSFLKFAHQPLPESNET